MRDVWGVFMPEQGDVIIEGVSRVHDRYGPTSRPRQSTSHFEKFFASRDAIHGAKGGPEGELSSGSVLGPVNNLV